MSSRPSTKQLLLWLFLGSIAVNATLGILALIAGDFGQTESKILVTSLLVSAAMLSVLVNRAAIDRRVLWPFPGLGAIVAVASFALSIVSVWAEIDDPVTVKLVVSGLALAGGSTLTGLLALIALSARYEPVRATDYGLVAVTVLTALAGLWFEIEATWYGRLLGVECVLVAAVTLAVPVLARFDSAATPSPKVADVTGRQPAAPPPSVTWPVEVPPDATIEAVIDELCNNNSDYAVVTDNGRRGVVSSLDLLRAVRSGADLAQLRAVDLMTPDASSDRPRTEPV